MIAFVALTLSQSTRIDRPGDDPQLFRYDQPVTLNAAVAEDSGIKITGSLQITASQFGFEPYSALLGQLKNQDNMDLKIKLVGR